MNQYLKNMKWAFQYSSIQLWDPYPPTSLSLHPKLFGLHFPPPPPTYLAYISPANDFPSPLPQPSWLMLTPHDFSNHGSNCGRWQLWFNVFSSLMEMLDVSVVSLCLQRFRHWVSAFCPMFKAECFEDICASRSLQFRSNGVCRLTQLALLGPSWIWVPMVVQVATVLAPHRCYICW